MHFPAGTYKVGTTWRLWTITQHKRTIDGEEFVRDAPDRPFAMPSKTFTITVAPATPANRWALAARLEAEFTSLPPASNKDGDDDSPFMAFCDRVLYAPHPELIPLYFKALDRTPLVHALPFARETKRKLAESIFAADPAKAHRLFVDRLLAPKVDLHSYAAFDVWARPGTELVKRQKSLFAVFQPWFWFEPKLWSQWAGFDHVQWLTAWAREAPPLMLPDAELRRLATATDPNVQQWVRSAFGNRLGND